MHRKNFFGVFGRVFWFRKITKNKLFLKLNWSKNVFCIKVGFLCWYSSMKINYKDSDNFWHRKMRSEFCNFASLSTLSEKVQKKFNTFIEISFQQIPLTWWNAYLRVCGWWNENNISQKWQCGLAEWDAFNELILEIHYVVSGEET